MATKLLDTFTKQGYVLDKNRLINGQIFDEDYFDHLVAEIQEIRASERRFYQKITDIYATAVDYDKDSVITRDGRIIISDKIDDVNKIYLNINKDMMINVTEGNIPFLKYHRENVYVGVRKFALSEE